jgi:hypothetical protein
MIQFPACTMDLPVSNVESAPLNLTRKTDFGSSFQNNGLLRPLFRYVVGSFFNLLSNRYDDIGTK